MNSIKEETKLLASLVVFRELYDNQKDVYGVIAEFLKEVIVINGKHRFNVTEITNLLNNTFDFLIPEAVVNTALKRLNLPKEDGYYIVQDIQNMGRRRISDLQEQNLNHNADLISNLVTFIETERSTALSDSEKTRLVRSFCCFLLDDSTTTDYSEYISGFTIKNKNDENFRMSLKKIREGVILYSGVKYNNLSEVGSWRTNLTVYLDTEILFHFAGYNGELYKSHFEDFFKYVKEINSKAKKIIIRLEYFEEVRKEIEDFFTKAEYIVDGKDRLNPRNTAMTSVIEGCKSPSDVLSKKSDFYNFIKKNGIYESERTSYFAEDNHKYNIADLQTIQSISTELGADISENMNFLNYVNIRRKGEIVSGFENVGHILLTGNTLTLKVALNEKIKCEGVIPLATNLNWITNRFWFKLNKGFGDENFPATFDAITKAQMVLSSILSKSIGEKFDELQQEFNQGRITEEMAKSRVIELRSQVKKPEDIQQEDVSQIIDVLSEDSLEKFAKEQEFSKNKAAIQSEENARLKKELIRKEEDLEKEKKEQIKIQREIINSYEIFLKDKIDMVKALEIKKNPIDKLASKDFINFKILAWFFTIIIIALPIFLTLIIGFDIISPLTWLFLLLPVLIVLITGKELNWNPKKFLETKQDQFKLKRYAEFNFDIIYMNKLTNEINSLKEKIENLKIEYHLN